MRSPFPPSRLEAGISRSNTELVQGCYAAFAAGDIPALFGAFHPQIVWTVAESLPTFAEGNPYIGPQAIGEGIFGRIVAEWDNYTFTPEKIIDGGDTIVVQGRYRATRKSTGLPLDAQGVHFWTIQDGKVTAFQQYSDTLQYARAMQVVVPPPVA